MKLFTLCLTCHRLPVKSFHRCCMDLGLTGSNKRNNLSKVIWVQFQACQPLCSCKNQNLLRLCFKPPEIRCFALIGLHWVTRLEELPVHWGYCAVTPWSDLRFSFTCCKVLLYVKLYQLKTITSLVLQVPYQQSAFAHRLWNDFIAHFKHTNAFLRTNVAVYQCRLAYRAAGSTI